MHMDLEDLPWKPKKMADRNRFLVCVERLVKWLTPMKREEYAFTDRVTGEAVFYFRDAHGQRWMKNSKFGLFKVKAN